MQAGIPSTHIEIAEICTFSSSEWFSYRRNRDERRNVTIAGLDTLDNRYTHDESRVVNFIKRIAIDSSPQIKAILQYGIDLWAQKMG